MGKRKWGDRRDAVRVKTKADAHGIMPYLLKRRCDSLVYFSQEINIDNLIEYIKKRQQDGTNITLFQCILVGIIRTLKERPELNRYVIGRRLYQRKDVRASFVTKRQMRDDSDDENVLIVAQFDDTAEKIVASVSEEINKAREEGHPEDEKVFKTILSMPRILIRGLIRLLSWFDWHGLLPKMFEEIDPMHAGVFISNLGSIGIDAAYHHLYEWGTCSIFVTIGRKKKTPVIDENGNAKNKTTVEFKFTVDERISSGYYIARSLHMLKRFLEHPENLFIEKEKIDK